jgi:hypothetical protein
MKRTVLSLAAAAMTAALAGATPVWAEDDAAMKARMADLERENQEMKEEMRELRELLEASVKKPAAAPAGAEAVAEPARVEEVERKQDVITEEVRKIREALVLPETKELKSEYGLGPAASKVYGVSKGF